MEILLHTEYQRLILGYFLGLVTPLSGEFDGCFDSFSACVHGEQHVEAEQAGGEFGETREDVVVEGAGGEGEAAGLLGESFD
jgi:hypothetical protein